MPKSNMRQALRPAYMKCIPNPHGTAPGLAGDWTTPNGSHRCLVFSLPGPPREMQPMFADHVVPVLCDRGLVRNDHVLLTASVHEFGMGESTAAQNLGDLMNRDRDPLVGTTASDSIVTARIRTSGPRESTSKILDETMAAIVRAWHPHAFGRENCTLAHAAGNLLLAAHSTIAVAESCTGGLLSKFIVDVPGSSNWFRGGWVTYSNDLQTQGLGVDAALINEHGAVSAQVAVAMAQGARDKADTDWALAITGIAGPDGGTTDKPVGTVYIGIARRDAAVRSRHFEFTGDRSVVRDRSAKAALQVLRFALLNEESTPLLWEVSGDSAPLAGAGGRG
jgi:nicotinamide-nucleotide amidase